MLVSSDESEMDEADESVTYTKLVSLKRPAEATKSKRAKRLKRAKKKKRKFDPAANQPKNSKQLTFGRFCFLYESSIDPIKTNKVIKLHFLTSIK